MTIQSQKWSTIQEKRLGKDNMKQWEIWKPHVYVVKSDYKDFL